MLRKLAQSDSSAPQPAFHNSLIYDVITGLGTGASCAGLFNPWDLALYRSLSRNQKFRFVVKSMAREVVHAKSIMPMYKGALQAMTQRSASWGFYYAFQKQGKIYLYPALRERRVSEFQAQLFIGISSGSLSGLIANPISATKYYVWKNTHHTFLSAASEMAKHSGIKRFFMVPQQL